MPLNYIDSKSVHATYADNTHRPAKQKKRRSRYKQNKQREAHILELHANFTPPKGTKTVTFSRDRKKGKKWYTEIHHIDDHGVYEPLRDEYGKIVQFTGKTRTESVTKAELYIIRLLLFSKIS